MLAQALAVVRLISLAGISMPQVERMDVDCELDIDRFVAHKTYMAAQYSDIYFSESALPRVPY